jgi:hypothetical protein
MAREARVLARADVPPDAAEPVTAELASLRARGGGERAQTIRADPPITSAPPTEATHPYAVVLVPLA